MQINQKINLSSIHRTSAAEYIAKLPVNTIAGLAFGGPERNVLFAVAEASKKNVNTRGSEQRIQRKSYLYKIVDGNGSGRQFKRADV